MNGRVRSVYDWKCVFLGSSTNPENNVMDSNSGSARGFFLGMGRQKVFKLTPSNRGGYAWMPFNLAKFELASGTLLYGEVVEEKRGEARSMRRVMAFHVIDALYLGGEDVRDVDFKARNAMITAFCQVSQTRHVSHSKTLNIPTFHQNCQMRITTLKTS